MTLDEATPPMTTTTTTEITPAMRDEYMREIVEHKNLVARYLLIVLMGLSKRMASHDDSKFAEPEFSGYLPAVPIFHMAEQYGDERYMEACRVAKPAIKHHVTGNRHHPEFHDGSENGGVGVNGMNLLDVIEMVCDWMAACQRNGGSLAELDLTRNWGRYGIEPQLASIIENTVATLRDHKGME